MERLTDGWDLRSQNATSIKFIKIVSEREREFLEREKKMITDGVENEEKWLAAGIAGLQQNAFYMHRALVKT